METIDNIFSEIEKVLANQQINQELLNGLELRIKEYRCSQNTSQMSKLDGSLQKKKSSMNAEGEKLEEMSLQDEDKSVRQEETNGEEKKQLAEQQTWFSEKQLQKLINLTSNDSNRFSKSYVCGSVLLMCFENELISIERIENIRLIINLINSLCNLIDKLNGLDMCFQLGSIINSTLNYLIKQADFSAEYKDYLNRMKCNPMINGSRVASNFIQYERRISQMAMQDDFSQKIQAVNLIFDLFSECISYSEQMTLFSYSITNILKDIVRIPVRLNEQEEQIKMLMVLLSKFVLTLLVIPETQIEFDPNTLLHHINENNNQSDANALKNIPIEYFFHSKDNFLQVLSKQGTKTDREMGNVINYSIRGIKEIITQSEHIYGNIALIVNSLLLFPNNNEIMRYCLSILKNLYKQFPNFRKKLETPILTVFQNICNLEDQECHQQAANFLYELLNNPTYEDESFIDSLTSNEKITGLQSSPFFDSKYVSCTLFNKQIFKFEDLVIHKTFATQQTIEAEKSYCFHIEIKKPFSIVYIGFATQSNDIKVTFQKLDDFCENQGKRENANVIRTFLSQRINCEQDPYRLVLLAEKKGIYKIEFDNTYSWYNSKLLRFRCLILEPEISDCEILRKKLLFSLVKFDQMDLNLYKKFDGNWCQLYILNHSIDIQVDTFDKQSLRKVITSVNFKEVNKAIVDKFQSFYKQEYLSILIIYEQSAWSDLLNHYGCQLVEEGYHTKKEIEERRNDRSFQIYLIKRYMHEHFTFITQFKSLSLEVVEDTNYFWFKNESNFITHQNNYTLTHPTTTTNQTQQDNNNNNHHQQQEQQQQEQEEQEQQQDEEVILISKSNPVTKQFQLKLYKNNALQLIQLEDLDDDIFEQYELLIKLHDSEEYFSIYCEFMKRFLVRHSSIGITKIIIFADPSNMFWNDTQLKLLKTFFETQLPKDVKIPALVKSSI